MTSNAAGLAASAAALIEHAPTVSLFDLDVQCLVNPVNTRGAMGAGLAKAFADRHPDALKEYRKICRARALAPGGVWWWRHPESATGPQWTAHLATKDDWRDPSQLKWVEDGIAQLAQGIRERGITSIAVPALGCGLGGLSWPDVRASLALHLSGLEGVAIHVIPPASPRFRPRP